MRHVYGIVLLGVVITSPMAAHAQQGQGASAMASDAMSMLRSGPLSRTPGEAYELLEAAPDAFPKELVPAGAAVVAASMSGSLTVVVSALKAGMTFDQVRFQWKLEDVGWISPTPPRMGFSMTSQYGVPTTPPVTVCRGGDFVTLMVRTLPTGDRLVRASLGKDPQRSCAPVGMRMFSDVPIPMLELPPGVRSSGGGGGGGTDDTESRTRLDTTMGVDALAKHFAAQLTAAGWRVESGPTGDDVMSVTRLSVTSKAGDPITGQLLLTALSGTTSIDAVLRVVRNKPAIR